jgi:hypothetical protein
MYPALASLLRELEAVRAEHDGREPDRARRMLSITADAGPFLTVANPST